MLNLYYCVENNVNDNFEILLIFIYIYVIGKNNC